METQIYLLLARKAGDFSAGGAAIWVKQVMKDMILGDSLDTPFLKFIRVQSIEHSIGFPGRKSVVEEHGGHAVEYKSTGHDEEAGDYDDSMYRARRPWAGRNYRRTRWGTYQEQRAGQEFKALQNRHLSRKQTFFSTFKNNQYVAPALPTHEEFTFTKLPDNATPQLMYGCSAQEPMAFACFFFRRRIGAGIMGVRLPFMMIGLRKCLITGWQLGDDMTETVTLSYKDIIWSTFDQLADINVPTGMSARVWQTDTKEGGETMKAYIPQAILAALTVIVGASVALTNADDGVKKG